MPEPAFHEVNRDILRPLNPPRAFYFLVLTALGAVTAWGAVCWMYQVRTGMRVTGLSIPVGWAVYITNFVFWVGIGHAGTLISAILFLVRSKWRTAVSRSAEAMTIFAVMTAALFPLVHLGRLWVFWYILPYPSQRQLWPNFISPLVWDVVAVGTYFTVSVIFFYVGLLPDLAAARDHFEAERGPESFRARFYRALSLGWTGSGNQWRHHGRAYLYFAALATPLVISVHSVVSWDFAMSLLPGWHTTIFAPYFVAGAIHSGLAMVLTLLIPLRYLFHLEKYITRDHFESVAKTMIATGLIVGYAYILEPFFAWFSGDIFEQQFAGFRFTGWIAPLYWPLWFLNVLAPLAFIFGRARRSIAALFTVGILVNIGMWLERLVIIAGSTAHDFLPHNWNTYAPTWVEISISLGSFAFFLFWFFVFSRVFPTVAMSDVKEVSMRREIYPPEAKKNTFCVRDLHHNDTGVLASYGREENFLDALRNVQKADFERFETYSPMRVREAEVVTGRGPSPVRLWTFSGALTGMIGGFALAILTANVNALIVGGKHPVSIIPYCIVAFEGAVLLGTISNFIGTLIHSRLGRIRVPSWYRPRFSVDRYGIFIACGPEWFESAKEVLGSVPTEDIDEIHP